MPPKKRRITKADRRVAKVYGELKAIAGHHKSQDKLTMREAIFARLIAEEGYTLTDAYVESFKPTTENGPSLNVMASRIGARPRVKAEIDRIRRAAVEAENAKESLPKLLRNQEWLRDQIGNGLYELATQSDDQKVRLKAWELLGRSRTADYLASGTTISNTSNTQVNNLGIQSTNDAAEMRSSLVSSLTKLLEPPGESLSIPAEVIDIQSVSTDDGTIDL